jgi:hypothetical protein
MRLRHHRLIAAFTLLATTLPLYAQEGITSQDARQWRGIARLKNLKANGKIRGQTYSIDGQYPVFLAKTRLARFANLKVKRYATKGFQEFLALTKKEMSAENLGAGYEYESGPILSTYKPARLISLSMCTYRYMAGAHGLGLSNAITYAIVNGKPKEIGLADCFLPGTAYRPLVEKLIFAKLKSDERAEWVHDGTVKSLTPEQFNNFTVEKDGLEWTFNPYEMGSYAAGPIDVKLSPAELGPGVRKSLLWGR